MSEIINNQGKKRQEALKELIKQLHDGKDVDQVKVLFEQQFGSVTTEEIVALEQGLIDDGMSVKEIEKLCDIHAAVMGTDVHSIHQGNTLTEGHPLKVLVDENTQIETLINEEIRPYITPLSNHHVMMLRIGFYRLKAIDKHYKRKEHLFFPYLENKGILTPPQVMWGVDDTIRAQLKATVEYLDQPIQDAEKVIQQIQSTLTDIEEMIFKENNILVPLLSEQLNLLNFIDIAEASDEIGYFLEAPEQKFLVQSPTEKKAVVDTDDTIQFGTGKLKAHVLESLLNTLPIDITFVDENDRVQYFSHGKDRIFERPKTVIGRHVHQCHPPSSVATVETIIDRFKSGEKDEESFWIQMRGRFVHIRYLAVRTQNGAYLGTLEMTQDIAPLRALESEKRLLEDLD